MAKILHINCPKCGGTLGTSEFERVVECRYCNMQVLVEGADFMPRYYYAPKVTNTRAMKALNSFFEREELPDLVSEQAKIYSSRIYFVPFYEIGFSRIGALEGGKTEKAGPPVNYWPDNAMKILAGVNNVAKARWQDAMHDTKIMFNRSIHLVAAADISEWGLFSADISKVRVDSNSVLQNMDTVAAGKIGKILEPDTGPERYFPLERFRDPAASAGDHTQLAELNCKLIFYPVWRLRYQYKGKLYGMTVDGMTGTVLRARGPRADKNRPAILVGGAALAGLCLGATYRIVQIYFNLDHNFTFNFPPVYLHPGFVFYLAIGGLTLAGMAWEQFRYKGEVVQERDKLSMVYLNKPYVTWVDRLKMIFQEREPEKI